MPSPSASSTLGPHGSPAELRPLEPGDVPRWAGLLAAVQAADGTGQHYSEADLAEELDDPALADARDTVAAWCDGELAGYVLVLARGGSAQTEPLVVYLDAGVAPSFRGRGVGSRLADAALARAREMAKELGRPAADVRTDVLVDDHSAERLLESRGFTTFRFSFNMARDLGVHDAHPGQVPEPAHAMPGGLTSTPYAAGRDDDDLLAAHNVAFADYPGFSPWTAQEWRQRVSGTRNLAPGGTRVVRDSEGRVAAYLVAMEYDADTAATGRRELYVAKLGTVPDHRGHGVGSSLLAEVLRHAADAGYAYAALDVDTENPSGALGIYERAGFGRRVSWRTMRALLPVTDADGQAAPAPVTA